MDRCNQAAIARENNLALRNWPAVALAVYLAGNLTFDMGMETQIFFFRIEKKPLSLKENVSRTTATSSVPSPYSQ